MMHSFEFSHQSPFTCVACPAHPSSSSSSFLSRSRVDGKVITGIDLMDQANGGEEGSLPHTRLG